MRLVVFS